MGTIETQDFLSHWWPQRWVPLKPKIFYLIDDLKDGLKPKILYLIDGPKNGLEHKMLYLIDDLEDALVNQDDLNYDLVAQNLYLTDGLIECLVIQELLSH